MGADHYIERVSEAAYGTDPRFRQYEPNPRAAWGGTYTLPISVLWEYGIPFGPPEEVESTMLGIRKQLPENLRNNCGEIDFTVRGNGMCESIHFLRGEAAIPLIFEQLNKIYPICLYIYAPDFAVYDLDGLKKYFIGGEKPDAM